jgi:predicted ATPase
MNRSEHSWQPGSRRHPRRLINCVVQNSRLAHPGLALNHQRRTPAALTSLEQLTDAMALAIAPD